VALVSLAGTALVVATRMALLVLREEVVVVETLMGITASNEGRGTATTTGFGVGIGAGGGTGLFFSSRQDPIPWLQSLSPRTMAPWLQSPIKQDTQ
jgi:hypothetical protein